jgi:hypothetical protein
MDVVLALCPWLILRRLQMRTAEKLGVALAMSMGLFAGVCAFAKAAALPVYGQPDFSCESSVGNIAR